MVLADTLVVLAANVLAMLVPAVAVSVGPRRFLGALRDSRRRFVAVAPYLLPLAVVLAARRLALSIGPEISWYLEWNVTGFIYGLEGTAVVRLQELASPLLTDYFVFVYLYGYVFLLVFPIVAYFALDDTDRLAELLVAFVLNYGIGLVCYVLFVAYGPRNVIPEVVDSLLYTTQPTSQHLTGEVNRNTNVFPSLHASLSATVALFAWRTRSEYVEWLLLAVPLAVSVAVATMYLGIHWVTDVAGGLVLAGGSYWLAIRVVDRYGCWESMPAFFSRLSARS
ncbi:phosphatase PAP2 family protein [Halobacterium bonnevillei]|uniref:Phosphatase PAP2 family protein n=1 Tax=Halobacterium bonnevillei TaxID=2692200 RepID=A0A6B0SK25_9EURY|nr:phosphatase PAP2 family protein [Halobacterium bonnevillei]MXR21537.1 phosphatase PAP2 family protein [Halobacterium bonnevillei]